MVVELDNLDEIHVWQTRKQLLYTNAIATGRRHRVFNAMHMSK